MYYYDLFKFFSDEHDLILFESEIQDIIDAVKKFENKNNNASPETAHLGTGELRNKNSGI